MRTPRSGAETGLVVVDYRSPDGPVVTHLRGMLLVTFLAKLSEEGLEERYLNSLPVAQRGGLNGVIASSWVDVEFAMTHIQACEALGVADKKAEELGHDLASRIADTWLGTIVRAARNSGIEAMGAVLKQNDRSFSRMYRGGRTMVTEYGPKEMVIEDHGNPLLSLRLFRSCYLGFMMGLAELFTKSAHVRLVPPQQHDRHGIATRFSWV